MASEVISYDKAELRAITKAFKGMDDTAAEEAKRIGGELASMALNEIQGAARGRTFANAAVTRIADGGKVSKSSKIGEMSFGFAGQKFSGGATTKDLWGGMEFGSNKFKQFPRWSGRYGRGTRGYWIYPTLRDIQPKIVRQWEESFSQIVKEW